MIKKRYIITLSSISIILIVVGSGIIYISQKSQKSFFSHGIENTIDKGLLNANFDIGDKVRKRIEDIKEIAVLNEEAFQDSLNSMKYLGILLICLGGAILDVSYLLHKARKSG